MRRSPLEIVRRQKRRHLEDVLRYRLLSRDTGSTPRALPPTRWKEVQDLARGICGVRSGEVSPGLAWAHALGTDCSVDNARGIGELLSPRNFGGRSVLRLDLRGRGRSSAAHEESRGAEQYTWHALAQDFRICSRAALSRAFFGGEGAGAAVVLHAAVAAHGAVGHSASVDAPPGLVLMRPPNLLVPDDILPSNGDQRRRYEDAASVVEAGSPVQTTFEELEVCPIFAADVDANLPRAAPAVDVAAAVLRGHAASDPPQGLAALKARPASMAGDAYGVPQTLQCPVLILAMPGDEAHSVEGAERLAELLPGAELVVAASAEEASTRWSRCIADFLKKAWMKEFLTKRVMPQ